MGDFFARVLLHPAAWSQATPNERIFLALAVLVATVVLATLAGVVSSRWARARAAKVNGGGGAHVERMVTRVRRGAVSLLALIGSYLAVGVAPLPPHVDVVSGGVLWVLAAIVAARMLINLVALLLVTSVARVSGHERERLQREYIPLGEKATALAVTLILVIVVFKHFGQDVTSLVAALGVGSLAIGLAAQQTLGNMIAGFTILVDRPFRPGDRIKLATGEAGEVLEIGVRSTRIQLADRNLLIVPNTELANSRVINFAAPHKISHAEVKLTLAHSADLDAASKALVALAADDKRVLADPPPAARVAQVTPAGVELVLALAVEIRADAASVEESLRRRALKRFAEEKLALARTYLA
ncbi:MAG TPA: mechanosensitive ion channel family protein [Polyangia bacterium]|nr:mechanosensitive ion channel family protein [Polyangia bacterium]